MMPLKQAELIPQTWQFDGGYITLDANGAATSWNYYVTDHLGSTRKVVTSTNAVEETINYYPYGSEMTMTSPSLTTNPNWQPFRFSGKELDKLNGLNMYDFGARWFDVAGVPVWTSVDPLAEDNCPVTPYSYCNGDPVNRIDPDGMEDLFWMDKNDALNNAMYRYDKYCFSDNPNLIVIWAHGNEDGFSAIINNKEYTVKDAESFVNLLDKNSELWKEHNGKNLTIVLNSCKTAGFAEKELINNEKLQDRNLTIIAPTENVRVRIKEVYKNDRNPLMRWIMGDYKTKTIGLFSVIDDGKWNVFRTGKGLVKTYPGNANPGKKNFRL